MKRVLMVAYHFPPQMGSSGFLRTLKYSRYLPDYDWQPTILTTHPRAYERTDLSLLTQIPEKMQVVRAFALDTRKHLAYRGRYFRFTSLPDRWITWCIGATIRGAIQIYRQKIDVIYTTFPIATAVLIGYILHQMTGVPWVADFRDPMTEEDYPHDPRTRSALRWLERKAVKHAAKLIFTAHSTMRMYLQRYPELSPDKCQVISNGYDEQDFAEIVSVENSIPVARIRMQHSGLIYPEERDPLPFFRALARLKKDNRISAVNLSVDLRACGEEDRYRKVVEDLGIEDIVHFLPALPYKKALEDSNQSDLLLLLQAACCDHQIPAKTYEYLRLHKPILALTSRTGDTAALLDECGGATIVDIADEDAIYQALPDALMAVREGRHSLPRTDLVAQYSRQSQTADLARCLFAVSKAGRMNDAVAKTCSRESSL